MCSVNVRVPHRKSRRDDRTVLLQWGPVIQSRFEHDPDQSAAMPRRNNAMLSAAAFCTVLLAAGQVRAKKPTNPFSCGIVRTFSDDLNDNDVALIAELVEAPPDLDLSAADLPASRFRIVHVLRGAQHLAAAADEQRLIDVLYVGKKPPRHAVSAHR